MRFIEFTREFIPAVVKMQSESFSDGWTEKMLLSAFDSGNYFGYLAIENETVAGYIGCDLGLDACDLETVFVAPEFRRQRIAEKLISLAQDKILSGGVKTFILEVREGNLPAINLYNKLGFKQISTRKKYYPDGENALVLVKEL